MHFEAPPLTSHPRPLCLLSGALLAIGILNACVQNENDPAFALISDYVSNPDPNIRIGAILGLGLAYAGTNREEVEVRGKEPHFEGSVGRHMKRISHGITWDVLTRNFGLSSLVFFN